jgi:hypothetical protein
MSKYRKVVLRVAISIASFGITWFLASFLTSTIGDVVVVGSAGLNTEEITRNAGFAGIETPFSVVGYSLLLGILWVLRVPRLVGNTLFFLLTGLLLGIVEGYLLFPFAKYAWSGHDYETLLAIGRTKFDIGVAFETASGPVACIAGTLTALSIALRKTQQNKGAG